MSQITKKIKLLSTDIYNFSNDPFRKVISDLDESTLEIKLKDNVGINFAFEQNIPNTNTFEGNFEINCGTLDVNKVIAEVKKIINVPINNSYISLDKHFEINEEIKKAGLQNSSGLLKFEANFTYNYLSKNYETFLKEYPNLLEYNYPYFYEIISQKVADGTIKNFDGKEFFSDPTFINTNNTRNDLKTIIFPSKALFANAVFDYNKVLSVYNVTAKGFPFYCNLFIDFHKRMPNNISGLFHDYNIYNLLMSYSTNYNTSQKMAINDNNSNVEFKQINKKIFGSDLGRLLIQNLPKDFNEFSIKFNANLLINNIPFADTSRSNILSGAPNYSEVIGYVLNKYDLFGSSAAPLQQWLLPNLDGQTLVNLVDTQIKYNKKYRYSIDLLVMNTDMTYKYTMAQALSDTTARILYTYDINPSVVLIKNSAEYLNKVMSSPPVKPYIESMPYVNTPNKLKFVIYNNSIQNTVEKPMPILATDELVIEDVKMTQNRQDGKIAYNFDDGVATKFEVFRTTEKPTSYKDFDNKLYKTILSSDYENVSFEDNITPEKYYYYTFRSIDYHEQFSNPTEIYEVVHTNGSLNVNILQLGVEPIQLTKIFRKFIQISPSPAQTEMAEESYNDVKLGINSDSVWDRKFKIRLTSRSTGKKIDLNLTFKYNVRDN